MGGGGGGGGEGGVSPPVDLARVNPLLSSCAKSLPSSHLSSKEISAEKVFMRAT